MTNRHDLPARAAYADEADAAQAADADGAGERADQRPNARPAVRWQVRLLGDVVLDDGQGRPLQLPTHASAALLARLALAPQRAHAREELIELLWPGVALPVGRNRLRNVLSTLKSVLEPDRTAPVLLADRLSVRVAAAALNCDALDFESAVRSGQFGQARALYRGELMPGYFDDWIADERLRLAAVADRLPAPPPPPTQAQALQHRPMAAALSGAAPAYLTRWFGRQPDQARLRAQVLAQRLVTLVGPGGFGKTRLAAELARELTHDLQAQWLITEAAATRSTAARTAAHPAVSASRSVSVPASPSAPASTSTAPAAPFDPILFIALVACTSRAEVLQQLAVALACEAQLPAIERALAGRRALLVLDNFEHLVDCASDVPQALLARLTGLHLLITSRRLLGLDGEHGFVLVALPAPAPDLSLADAMQNPAVALFIDRAQAARADFAVTPANLASVVGLVSALEGMPLALELAAARCRTLAPAAMLGMLTDPALPQQQPAATPALDLLERRGPRGDRDSRQASMAHVVAWSWDLLSAEGQSLLADLTVFRAHFSAQAVAAVTGLSALEAGLQLDALASDSLLQVRPTPDAPDRIQLLDVIREYAASHLPAARQTALHADLRQWLIDWALIEGRMPLPARIEPELAHVHAVLASAGDPAVANAGAHAEAMTLALALRDYWELDGMPPHSQHALERALAEHGAGWSTALRGDAHELLAYTSVGAGDAANALAHADSALALAGDDDGRRGRALLRRVWVKLAIDYQTSGQDAALDQAMALAQRSANLPLQARTLHQQGIVARYQQKDASMAEALFARAQAVWAGLGNQRLAHARLRNRAQCWAAQGLHAQALASFLQCERAARADGDWVGIIDSTLGAATELTALRQWPQAVAKGAECIRVAWQRHHAHGLAYALWNIAHPMLRIGLTPDAVRLMAQASHYWTTHMGPLRAADQRDIDKLKRLARVRLNAAQVDDLWHAGTAMPVADAVALALRR